MSTLPLSRFILTVLLTESDDTDLKEPVACGADLRHAGVFLAFVVTFGRLILPAII